MMHFERRGLFELLEIRAEHILAVANLPPLHGDPFDRLILSPRHCPSRCALSRATKSLAGYSDTIIVG